MESNRQAKGRARKWLRPAAAQAGGVSAMRNLITLADLEPAEVERIFAITQELKTKYARSIREPILVGRVMALLFEKPSLRTRVSFEAAMAHMGGQSLLLGDDVGFGKRESLEDFARVLGSYVDVLVVRAKDHETLERIGEHTHATVINGLTNRAHPCQALADLYTLRETAGKLQGQKLAFIGDGNNVARSLAMGCGKVGMRMALATPEGHEFDAEFMETLRREVPFLELTVTDDPVAAVREAAVVYTDVWTSMGQEAQRAARSKIFAPYQVNAELMSHAPAAAKFMHCLPAKRGEEVTDAVIDGPQSAVMQQAENRMHVQKGVLAWLLKAR